VGGIGMGTLAGMLKTKGFKVTGSDKHIYPPMSEMLKKWEIEVFTPFDPQNLRLNPDLVIIGNVCKRDNPEVRKALLTNIPFMSLARALREFFLPGKSSLIVAGTHGKTTTSAILSWLLYKANKAPCFFLGGFPKNFNTSFNLKGGNLFVLEGDEYDSAFFEKFPKFLQYKPEAAIITSIEYDHVDIYPTQRLYLEAFRSFIRSLPPYGQLVVGLQTKQALLLAKEASCDICIYGIKEDINWGNRYERFLITRYESKGDGIRFDIETSSKREEDFFLPLPGIHNLRNALGAICLCSRFGIDFDTLKEGLSLFKGVRKRQELYAVIRGIYIYDDFAHHPTEVRETLKAIRMQHPQARILAVFEPKSNTSCRKIFQKEYSLSFDLADYVIIAKNARKESLSEKELLSETMLIRDINQRGISGIYIDSVEEIIRHLLSILKEKDVVVFLSNGNFQGVIPLLSERLK
jgi:UDP-N-acetylmuramate: L-alanyl-gamma-D-glutamyl-meso-diaminopimelate ligase